jgi:uncharacterized membrane protein
VNRDVITTLVELVGLVLICAGCGVLVAQWSPAGGLVIAGILLIAASLVIARQNIGD